LGSALPPIIYPFACEPLYEARNFFIILILTTSTLTFISLFHPTLQSYRFRPYRGIVFVVLGVSGILPLVYLGNLEAENKIYISDYSLYSYLYGGIFFVIGVVFFITNTPERFKAKSFDIIGSSHQIFHVCVLAGVFIHFNAAMDLFIKR